MGNKLFPNIKAAYDKFKLHNPTIDTPKPLTYNQPGSVIIWKTAIERDRWLLLGYTNTPIDTWRQAYYDLNQKPAPVIIIPETYIMGLGNNLNDQQLLDLNADDRQSCRICFGQGIAYVLRGLMIKDDIPTRLKAKQCWCHYKKNQNQKEPWE
jgi:hypothetical protein